MRRGRSHLVWLILGLAVGWALISYIAEAQTPSWQRDIPNESCADYGERIAAPCVDVLPTPWLPSGRLCGYVLWGKHWCKKTYTTCDKMPAPKYGHPYWDKHRSGCSCRGSNSGNWMHLGPGEVAPCSGAPQPDYDIFSDDFESGDLSAWSSQQP